MTALAIMVIKGPKDEFVLAHRNTSAGNDTYKLANGMALELKDANKNISSVLFLPNVYECSL